MCCLPAARWLRWTRPEKRAQKARETLAGAQRTHTDAAAALAAAGAEIDALQSALSTAGQLHAAAVEEATGARTARDTLRSELAELVTGEDPAG